MQKAMSGLQVRELADLTFKAAVLSLAQLTQDPTGAGRREAYVARLRTFAGVAAALSTYRATTYGRAGGRTLSIEQLSAEVAGLDGALSACSDPALKQERDELQAAADKALGTVTDVELPDEFSNEGAGA